MLKRSTLYILMILALVLASFPDSQAQTIVGRGRFIPISSYEDDPFVSVPVVERLAASKFDQTDDGRRLLKNDRVWIENEDFIYRKDAKTAVFSKFAWNPWVGIISNPWLAPMSNMDGNFIFPNEERFPLFRAERGPDGKIVLKDGLQVWTPQDLRLGMNTTFDAANAARDAAEFWAGRNIAWGQNGLLEIETHTFIDFNAFYSPSARMLFFGVVLYRLPGETDIKILETATSWEMAAHEAGHALLDTLKPNADHTDQGFSTWGESFGDQTAMWTSLRDLDRVSRLLTETNGNLNQLNSLSSLVEAFAKLIGKGTGVREAFNDRKISDTTDEVHDRSEVLTGAAYKIFLAIYDGLKPEIGAEEALRQAGQIMGFFLMRVADYTPENQITLEDVAKAYLKVDKEFFDYRYHNLLVDEFRRREIFDADSQREWLAHEAATPKLWLHPQWQEDKVEQLVQGNLDKLGVGQDFGLKVQSVNRIEPFGHVKERGPSRRPMQTIVRVQLTYGRGEGAQTLHNHGILVFNASGMLAEYHAPLPPDYFAPQLMDVFAQAQALNLIGHAAQLRLDQRGVPLSIVRKADGQLTVESRVMRGEGLNTYMEVFTLDNPRGERREIVVPPLPPDKRILISDDLLK